MLIRFIWVNRGKALTIINAWKASSTYYWYEDSISRSAAMSQVCAYLWPKSTRHELYLADTGTLISLVNEEMNEHRKPQIFRLNSPLCPSSWSFILLTYRRTHNRSIRVREEMVLTNWDPSINPYIWLCTRPPWKRFKNKHDMISAL